jgi:[FeFe] hydrogenase (group B1/B3)
MRNFVFSEIMKIRRQLMMTLAQMYEQGTLHDNIAHIPKMLLPGPRGTYRSSVYHEREVMKQRTKMFLGMDYERARDMELYEIPPIIEDLLACQNELAVADRFIQVIKEACDACPSGRYYATDLCRNCVAHSCYNSCPKKAIEIRNDRAVINIDLCVGCGLCAKACNFFAIVKLERPCERSCALHAISQDAGFAAAIDYAQCVNCGACYVACPFGATESPSQLLRVLAAIKKGEEIIAMYAPAIAAQFGPRVTPGQIKNALQKAGFIDARAVAAGADEVAAEEAHYLNTAPDTITTSCCPAFVDYVIKNHDDFRSKISPAPSPMIALARKLKNGNQKIAFIGPCIAKKKEALKSGIVDYVLTFEELGALFIAKGIEPASQDDAEVDGSTRGWGFAAAGGVAAAVKSLCQREIRTLKMDGLSEGKEVFQTARQEKYDLIEGMACAGGCIAGPCIMVNPKIAAAALKKAGAPS